MTHITKITNRTCIIKASYEIYRFLSQRFADLELSHVDIINYAKNKGVVITQSTLSHYLNGFDHKKKEINPEIVSSLSQEKILWLCEHFGVHVGVETTMIPAGKIPYCKDNKHG